MANYIQISRDGGATWKKISTFVDGETIDCEPVTPALVDEDLSGNVVDSVGVAKIHCHYLLKVWRTPPDSAYADTSWIEAMFKTPGKVRLKPFKNSVVAECAITNRGAPNKRSITLDHDTLFSFDLDLLGVEV